MKNRNAVKVGLLLVGLATSIGFTQQTKAVEPDLKLDPLKQVQKEVSKSNSILPQYNVLSNQLNTINSIVNTNNVDSVDNVSIVEVPGTDITITFTPNEPEYTGAISDDPNNTNQDPTPEMVKEGYIKNSNGSYSYNNKILLSYNINIDSKDEYSAVDMDLILRVNNADNFVKYDNNFEKKVGLGPNTYYAENQTENGGEGFDIGYYYTYCKVVTDTGTNQLPSSNTQVNTKGYPLGVFNTIYFKGNEEVPLYAFVRINSITKADGSVIKLNQLIPIETPIKNEVNPNSTIKSYATLIEGKNYTYSFYYTNTYEKDINVGTINAGSQVIPYRTLMGYGENAPADIANKLVVIDRRMFQESTKGNYYRDDTTMVQLNFSLDKKKGIEFLAIPELKDINDINSYQEMTFQYENSKYITSTFNKELLKKEIYNPDFMGYVDFDLTYDENNVEYTINKKCSMNNSMRYTTIAYIIDLDMYNQEENDNRNILKLEGNNNSFSSSSPFFTRTVFDKVVRESLPENDFQTSNNIKKYNGDNKFIKANETGYLSSFITGEYKSYTLYPDSFEIEREVEDDTEIEEIIYTTEIVRNERDYNLEPYFLKPVKEDVIAEGDIVEYGYSSTGKLEDAEFKTTFEERNKDLSFIRLKSKQGYNYYKDKPYIRVEYTNQIGPDDSFDREWIGVGMQGPIMEIKTESEIKFKNINTNIKLLPMSFILYFSKYNIVSSTVTEAINNVDIAKPEGEEGRSTPSLYEGDVLKLKYQYVFESNLPTNKELNEYDKEVVSYIINTLNRTPEGKEYFKQLNYSLSGVKEEKFNSGLHFFKIDLTDMENNSVVFELDTQSITNKQVLNYRVSNQISNHIVEGSGSGDTINIDCYYNLQSKSQKSLQQLNFNQIIKPNGEIGLLTTLVNTTSESIPGRLDLILMIKGDNISTEADDLKLDRDFVIEDRKGNTYNVKNLEFVDNNKPDYILDMRLSRNVDDNVVSLDFLIEDFPSDEILTIKDLKVQTNNNKPGDTYTIQSKLINSEKNELLKSNVTKTEVDAEYDTLFITGADNISFGQLKLPMKDAENKTVDMINKPWTLSLTDKRIDKTDYAIYVQQTEAFKDVNNNQIDPYNISLGVLNNSNQDLIINQESQMLQSYINPTNTYQTLSYTTPQGFYLNFKNINQVKPSDYKGELLFTVSFDGI